MGVVNIEKALQISREHNLDLVQVTDKVDPPVCKIIDYGKYLYRQEKKEKNRCPDPSDQGSENSKSGGKA